MVLLQVQAPWASRVRVIFLPATFGLPFSVQVIVWPDVYAAHRSTILASRLLAVRGQWQRGDGGVQHLLARDFEDLSPLLGRLVLGSRDFR